MGRVGWLALVGGCRLGWGWVALWCLRLGWVCGDGDRLAVSVLALCAAESVVSDLEDSWASGGVVVSWGLVVLGEDEVSLARSNGTWLEVWNTDLWDGHGVAAARARKLDRGVATGGDEPSTLGSWDCGGVDSEGKNLTGSLGASWGDSDGWESLEALEDLEGAGWASWAGSDEWCSQGEDIVEAKGNVEWRWEWRQSWGLVLTEVCRVTGLNSQDGSCGGEVVWALYELGGTKVCADTDTLEDVGDGQEGWHISQAESVCALSDWSGTSGSQTSREEVDVGLLVELDLLQVVEEAGLEAGLLEICLGELGDSLTVEGVLQVLEGQSVLEDGGTGYKVSNARILTTIDQTHSVTPAGGVAA